MHLEIVCRTIDGHKNVILTGELQIEAWDGIIDAIIGAPHSRDVVTSMDHEANKLKATTIVSVPMHKVRDAISTQVSWNENPINTFVCISIKAVPLDASAIDTPDESPTTSPLPSSRGMGPPNFDLVMELPPSVMQLQSEQANVSSPHNTLRKDASGSFDQHSIVSEDSNAPAPELVESLKPVLGDVTSYRPFETVRPPSVPPAGAPPPPPPARPPSSQGSAAVPPPPPPTPPPMGLGDSPRPPPPSLAPPVPLPPPVHPTITSSVGPTLDTAAALARPPAPPMRHQKSRSSFIFVPSAAEDTQGITMQIPTDGSDFLLKQISAPPPPPQGHPVMEVSGPEVPNKEERFAPVVPAPPAAPLAAPPAAPAIVSMSTPEENATNSETIARLEALNAHHEATIASLNEKLQCTVTEHAATVAALQGLLKDSLQENVRLQVTIDTTEEQKQELQKSLQSHSGDVEKLKATHDLERQKLAAEAEKQRAALQSKLSALEEELSRKESIFAKQQMQCDMQSVQLKRLAAGGNSGPSNTSSANNLIVSPLAGNSNNIPFSGGNDGHTPNSALGKITVFFIIIAHSFKNSFIFDAFQVACGPLLRRIPLWSKFCP